MGTINGAREIEVEFKEPLSLSNQNNGSYNNSKKSKSIEQMEKKKRCVSKIKIIWSFISFLISVADVTVILYLSYLHFSHSSDLIAWLMLLPILLNFIGIFTFLSDEGERKEMESLGCKRTKNFMFFPVIGPSFGALRLFAYALEDVDAENFERLESLLTKMKQYESFFRAAPEAFIQITFRIYTWSSGTQYHAEDYWTSVCLFLCLFTLGESHMYGAVIKYYKLFEKDATKDAWKIDHIGLSWRVGLFFFTFFSVGSRILADAVQKASMCFIFAQESFGEVIIVNFLCQFVLRAGLYALFNSNFGSKKRRLMMEDEGVYGAFTYSWKSLFMSFDFQSYNRYIFLWFYIENILMLLMSYTLVLTIAEVDLWDKYIYHIYAAWIVVGSLVAIGIKFGITYRWKRKQSKKNSVGTSSSSGGSKA